MMEQAEFLTPWVSHDPQGEGTFSMWPSIALKYDCGFDDTTGQAASHLPTAPNNFICRVIAEAAVMDLIAADADYTLLPNSRSEYVEPEEAVFPLESL